MRARLVPAGLLLTLNKRRVATAWEPTAPQRSSISREQAVCDRPMKCALSVRGVA
jgi:hypothetical protein